MSEPATEAGRRLYALIDGTPTSNGTWAAALKHDILAIEQEARADLTARIVAAVEAYQRELPTREDDPDPDQVVYELLRAIREASDATAD